MLRRLVIILVVIAGILVAADYGVRLYSESVVGKELEQSLGLSQKPSVRFGGWPFVPHLVSGDLPSASFTAADFSSHGVSLHQVNVTLDDVHVPTGRLVFGGGG